MYGIIEWCLIMDKQMRSLIEQGRLLNRSRWQRCVKQVIDYKSKHHLSSDGTYGVQHVSRGTEYAPNCEVFFASVQQFPSFQRIAMARAFTPGCMR